MDIVRGETEMKTTIFRSLITIVVLGLLATPAAGDVVLSGNAYIDGSGNLKYFSDGTVITTAGSGAGSQSDPWVFDLGGQNLDLNGYYIRGAVDYNTPQESTTFTNLDNLLNSSDNPGGVTSGSNGSLYFYGNAGSNTYPAGHIRVEAAGSISVNKVLTETGYVYGDLIHAGNIYLEAMGGPLTVDGYLSARHEGSSGSDVYGGTITLISNGTGAGVEVNGTSSRGYSIETNKYAYQIEQAGPVNITSAGDILIGDAVNLRGPDDAPLTLNSTGGIASMVNLDLDKVASATFASGGGASSITGSLLGFNTGSPDDGELDSAGIITYDPAVGDNSYLGGNTYNLASGGTLQPVPEPATLGFLALGGVMGLTRIIRRRRRI
jgi:hypothetical protein